MLNMTDSAAADEIGAGTYVTVPQAAAVLGISARRVRTMIRKGQLSGYKLGGWTAIPTEEVERWRRRLGGAAR